MSLCTYKSSHNISSSNSTSQRNRVRDGKSSFFVSVCHVYFQTGLKLAYIAHVVIRYPKQFLLISGYVPWPVVHGLLFVVDIRHACVTNIIST